MCLKSSKSALFCAVCAWLVQGKTFNPAQRINHLKHDVIYTCAYCAGYGACAHTHKIILTRVLKTRIVCVVEIFFSRARITSYEQYAQSNNNIINQLLNLVHGLKHTLHKLHNLSFVLNTLIAHKDLS